MGPDFQEVDDMVIFLEECCLGQFFFFFYYCFYECFKVHTVEINSLGSLSLKADLTTKRLLSGKDAEE